jgi:hypothetical protein
LLKTCRRWRGRRANARDDIEPWPFRSLWRMIGYLQKYRDKLPADLTLYVGGGGQYSVCVKRRAALATTPTTECSIAGSSKHSKLTSFTATTYGHSGPRFHHRNNCPAQLRESASRNTIVNTARRRDRLRAARASAKAAGQMVHDEQPARARYVLQCPG